MPPLLTGEFRRFATGRFRRFDTGGFCRFAMVILTGSFRRYGQDVPITRSRPALPIAGGPTDQAPVLQRAQVLADGTLPLLGNGGDGRLARVCLALRVGALRQHEEDELGARRSGGLLL